MRGYQRYPLYGIKDIHCVVSQISLRRGSVADMPGCVGGRYARMSPDDKMRLLELLTETKQVVAMCRKGTHDYGALLFIGDDYSIDCNNDYLQGRCDVR